MGNMNFEFLPSLTSEQSMCNGHPWKTLAWLQLWTSSSSRRGWSCRLSARPPTSPPSSSSSPSPPPSRPHSTTAPTVARLRWTCEATHPLLYLFRHSWVPRWFIFWNIKFNPYSKEICRQLKYSVLIKGWAMFTFRCNAFQFLTMLKKKKIRTDDPNAEGCLTNAYLN